IWTEGSNPFTMYHNGIVPTFVNANPCPNWAIPLDHCLELGAGNVEIGSPSNFWYETPYVIWIVDGSYRHTDILYAYPSYVVYNPPWNPYEFIRTDFIGGVASGCLTFPRKCVVTPQLLQAPPDTDVGVVNVPIFRQMEAIAVYTYESPNLTIEVIFTGLFPGYGA
ncbi:MAG: hypothetical protein ACREBU_19945, partial [Nitrososphaera sp.]